MKNASIKAAILLPSLIVLIAGIIALVIVVGVLSSNSTGNLTDRLMDARVNQYANEFRAFSEEVYGSIMTITPVIANYIDPAFAADVSDPRGEVIDVISGVLTVSDKVVSVWTCWEPNAFDGKDTEYANTAFHDATGRYIPCVYKDGNGIAIQALSGYNSSVEGEYYQGARNSGKPYITDPYAYNFGGKEIYVYTLAVPIYKDGKVAGVVGADINLQGAISVMNAGSILDDGYLVTISPGGFITTHTNSDMLLTHYDTVWIGNYRAQLESILASGGSFSVNAYSDVTDSHISFLGSSVTIGETGRNWLVCGIIPESTVNADANSLLLTIIAIGFALIVLVGITIFMIVRSSLMGLPVLTATAEAIALGDIDSAMPDTGAEKTRNEISLLMRAFANMTAGIRQQADIMSRISQGDYSISIPVRSDKDVINQAINNMLDSTNSTLNQISTASSQVSIGSKQIADGAQMLAQGATEQAATVEQLSASIGEVASKTGQNAEMAKEAASLSSVIKQNAQKGSQQMDMMMQVVKEINDASNHISRVIKVIDDIAFQTNILALNAAVEAARAGQHGKGFAVVAEEVGNLAAKSADAAKNTEGLIADSIEKANMGYTMAGDTAASLHDIVEGINRSFEIVTKIAQSSDEQASAIGAINTGIDQVAQVIQLNSATAQQSAAASEEMSEQSNMLEELVAQFKLGDVQEQLSLSSTSHGKRSPG